MLIDLLVVCFLPNRLGSSLKLRFGLVKRSGIQTRDQETVSTASSAQTGFVGGYFPDEAYKPMSVLLKKHFFFSIYSSNKQYY